MSVYQSFPSSAAALEAFAAGRCRRHVEIDGHIIDLVQAVAEQGRVVVDKGRAVTPVLLPRMPRDKHDECVAREVAWELSLASFDERTPVVRPKPGPVCPCCLRPEVVP